MNDAREGRERSAAREGREQAAGRRSARTRREEEGEHKAVSFVSSISSGMVSLIWNRQHCIP